jgi:hypothetical protein
MRVIVRQGALKPPLLDTNEAISVEIRNNEGDALYGVFLIPGPEGTYSFITSDVNEKDFTMFLDSFGIPKKLK